MSKILMYQPDPPFTGNEGEAIIDAVFLSFHFIILIFLIILLLYLFIKRIDFILGLVVYGFSIIMSMNSLTHSHIPLSPLFEIFFMIFQTSLFLLISFNVYDGKITKFGR